MADQVVRIGAPFAGISEVPDERGIQTILLQNLLPREGVLETAPQWRTLDADRPSNRGVYVFGVQQNATVITLAELAAAWTWTAADGTVYTVPSGHVLYIASQSTRKVVIDLTDFYGEKPAINEPYSFASLGRKVYFAGGGDVYQVDRNTLEPIPVTFAEGREQNTVPYITGRIGVRRLAAYNGLMWYIPTTDQDLPTHFTVDTTDPMIKDPSRVNTNGTVRYGPGQILFSDPYEADHVKWLSAFNVESDGCELRAAVPWNGNLLLLTTNGCWALSGDNASNWTMQQLSAYADCQWGATAVAIGQTVLWCGWNALWRLDTEGGIRPVRGLEWVFSWGQTVADSVRGYNRYNQFWVDSDRANMPLCATDYNGGRYYVLGGVPGHQLIVEVATEASTVTVDVVAGVTVPVSVESTRLLQSGGMLGGTPTGLRAMMVGDDVSGGLCFAGFRLRSNGLALNRIHHVAATVVGIGTAIIFTFEALDEKVRKVRYGYTSTKPDYIDGYMATPEFPVGGANVESSSWGAPGATTPAWQAAAGALTTPRWTSDAPVFYEQNCNKAGRDLLVWVFLSGSTIAITPKPAILEQLVISYTEEALPG